MLTENSIVYYKGQLYTVGGFSDDLKLMLFDNHYFVFITPENFLKECTIVGEL